MVALYEFISGCIVSIYIMNETQTNVLLMVVYNSYMATNSSSRHICSIVVALDNS